MAEAVKVRVRYDTKDENGETRRERNEKFDAESPSLDIPDEGLYLWQWFWNLSTWFRRVRSGVSEPIVPSEMIAWAEVIGVEVRPAEFAILHVMDMAFCEATNVEISEWRERDREKQRQEMDASKRGKGRR